MLDNEYYIFNKSVQGYNHIKNGKCCQDFSNSYQSEKYSVIAVADGHGSNDYLRTDIGSRFAVEAAISLIDQFALNITECSDFWYRTDEIILQLEKSILNSWHMKVEDYHKDNPFNECEINSVSDRYKIKYAQDEGYKKAYGTTLILFLITSDFCLGVQIGDGSCVILNKDGSLSKPIPDDENCVFNVTTSICDDNAIEEFRYYVSKELPLAVYLSSDGIEDSYSSEEEYFSLLNAFSYMFSGYDFDISCNEISDTLPFLSKRGSGDDVSIACCIKLNEIIKYKEYYEISNKLDKEHQNKEKQKASLNNIIRKYKELETNNKAITNDDLNIKKQLNDLERDAQKTQNHIDIIEKNIKDMEIELKLIMENINSSRSIVENEIVEVHDEVNENSSIDFDVPKKEQKDINRIEEVNEEIKLAEEVTIRLNVDDESEKSIDEVINSELSIICDDENQSRELDLDMPEKEQKDINKIEEFNEEIELIQEIKTQLNENDELVESISDTINIKIKENSNGLIENGDNESYIEESQICECFKDIELNKQEYEKNDMQDSGVKSKLEENHGY